jgi:hypothetical protein
MKRSNIKEAFGGEVPFTKFIASDTETSKRLLTSIDLEYEDGFRIQPEDPTQHSKRVDLVVRDSDQDVVLVIESQDATGWLDAIHASKISYYMYDKKCDDGVLICEDADEHIKGYVKWVNENTPLRITLVSVIIYQVSKEKPYCEFVCLIRPTQTKDKKVVRKSSTNEEIDNLKLEQCQVIYDKHPDIFTNVTKNYVSRTNVGTPGITVAINPYKSGGFWVEIWHAGKHDTEEFRQSFTEVCSSLGYEAKFQSRRGYVNGEPTATQDGAIDVARKLITALENKEILV